MGVGVWEFTRNPPGGILLGLPGLTLSALLISEADWLYLWYLCSNEWYENAKQNQCNSRIEFSIGNAAQPTSSYSVTWRPTVGWQIFKMNLKGHTMAINTLFSNQPKFTLVPLGWWFRICSTRWLHWDDKYKMMNVTIWFTEPQKKEHCDPQWHILPT